ncbi:hypothetical protein LLE49_19960 [Alicyclobacillus tolerans]|uniref:hypothetical protein n=1 Tax=Alicyclobacillus tolerans TaxID=90970 RepID=UPI001F286F13|nr:hypothetical protein [Alicyclobacillus tolerans]MCF8566999.1 hypothetical protein [Alicyclobacillus tolerans]
MQNPFNPPQPPKTDSGVLNAINDFKANLWQQHENTMHAIEGLLNSFNPQPHIETVILSTNEYIFHANGYRYNGLVTTLPQALNVTTGTRSYILTLHDGYNQVNVPDGSILTLPSDAGSVAFTLIRSQHEHSLPGYQAKLKVRDAFTGNGDTTKTYTHAMRGLTLNNNGSAQLTLSVNNISITLNSGDILNEEFEGFYTFSITATSTFSCVVRG